MALPDDFKWDPTDQWGKDWLKCSGKILAGVSQTVFPDGRWIANVNRHAETTAKRPYAYFRSRTAAMRSVERWACAHAARLRHEVATGARKAPSSAPLNRDEKKLARKLRG
ncbi:hypothetical protein [Xanthomonas translucens]|uniref:hypothetical protein n=1 Tax=Xanthomonas campestris pv. translucens TaxID=343 RepID=UPI00071E754C|nr:hypothetical protein [Xanthomonas translucens]KTF39570.1 hypothetical protein OZ12_11445 [Xanthomonas translucens pv. translucens]